MGKPIKLERKGYLYQGEQYRYTISPCLEQRNKYEVTIGTSDDPLVVGRELDLKFIRDELIPDCEKVGPKVWYGDRGTLVKAFEKYWAKKI